MPISELVRLVGQTVAHSLFRPDILLIVGVVLLMVYTQYQRTALLERRLFGFVKNRPAEQMLRSLTDGVVGGLIATAVFVIVGISLNEVGIWYLWGLAILLMFFHPRFMCFAYGAGILALVHLIWGTPRIDVPALMALVAILHLVESVLIFLAGDRGATPVFVRSGDGPVVGGFTLQKFWPLPFIALVGAVVPGELLQGAQAISMPDWWPIIRPSREIAPGTEYAFALFPVIAALGYSDIAVTVLPKVKARRTAGRLLAYSLGLLALAILAQLHVAFAYLAAFYSPLAHEWVIHASRASERRGVPVFSGRETMVLDVHPDSPAAKAGIQPGDIILSINGIPVETREDLNDAMTPWVLQATIEVENGITGERRILQCPERIPPLGVILVPQGYEGLAFDLGETSRWRRWFRRWSRTGPNHYRRP